MVDNYYVNIKKVGNDFSEREIKILEELVFNIITISTLQARSKKGKGGIPLVINELDKTDGDIVKKEFILGEAIEDDVFEDLKNIIDKRAKATFKRCDIENVDVLIGFNYSV